MCVYAYLKEKCIHRKIDITITPEYFLKLKNVFPHISFIPQNVHMKLHLLSQIIFRNRDIKAQEIIFLTIT